MARAIASGSVDGAGEGSASYLRWFRAVAIASSLVFAIYAVWSWATAAFWPAKSDFVSFWAAGRLALTGHPELAYNIPAHHAAEQAVGPVLGLLPFAYPPPFLALVTPFALLPFGAAFFAWVGATVALYGWTVRRIAPLPYAFAIPAGYINLLIGQNGFLMSAIFIGGLLLVETSPWLAGALLGLMLLKPQLAFLLPVAMLAGREWRVIGAAIASALALLLVGATIFGAGSYAAFLQMLPSQAAFLQEGRLTWSELASVFALAHSLGASETAAMIVHSAIAVAAAALTARAWWVGSDYRIPILAAASMLISPYIWTYDSLLLVVPLGWMLRDRRHPYAIAAAWLCALLPIVNYYIPVSGPNLTSVAAIICLVALSADMRREGSGTETSRVSAESSMAPLAS
jgi:hypothetical protein